MARRCFTITADALPGVFEVRLHGDVDQVRVEELRGLIRLFAGSLAADLVVDLAEVTRLDTTGLAALLDLHREARLRGCGVTVNNTPVPTRRMIAVAGLADTFGLEPLPGAADDALPSRPFAPGVGGPRSADRSRVPDPVPDRQGEAGDSFAGW